MHQRLLPILVGVSCALAATPRPGTAQSEYHWSDQFGNKSTLLNGTVIGGVSDLGAVFYNPGRLAQLRRPGFLLTGEAFEVNRVEVRVGEQDLDKVKQATVRGVPSLVAGMFTLPFLPGHRFAYSFLTRRRSGFDLFLPMEAHQDLLPEVPGQETLVGSWESVSSLDENWVGISWAHDLSPRMSVGVSTFGTYLGRKRRVELNARAVTEPGDASTFSRLREYRFRSYGLLWKAGLAADLAPFRLGLSITTPGITALGTGSIRYENLVISPDTGPATPEKDEVVVFRETGLKTATHSPASVGAGVSWIGQRAEIHLSGEWYSGVPRYRILGVDSIPSQSSADLVEYHVVDELRSIFNFGAGMEWQVSETFSAYGSIITDASSAPEDPYLPLAFGDLVSNSASQADGFHLGAGVSLEVSWIDLTAGITYGSTRETMENPVDTAGQELGQWIATAQPIRITRQRLRFLLGFTIPMVEEITDDSGEG